MVSIYFVQLVSKAPFVHSITYITYSHKIYVCDNPFHDIRKYVRSCRNAENKLNISRDCHVEILHVGHRWSKKFLYVFKDRLYCLTDPHDPIMNGFVHFKSSRSRLVSVLTGKNKKRTSPVVWRTRDMIFQESVMLIDLLPQNILRGYMHRQHISHYKATLAFETSPERNCLYYILLVQLNIHLVESIQGKNYVT
jgi:hypothetical protein